MSMRTYPREHAEEQHAAHVHVAVVEHERIADLERDMQVPADLLHPLEGR
jgi:hypothetical protein